jgi:hypothetical protein
MKMILQAVYSTKSLALLLPAIRYVTYVSDRVKNDTSKWSDQISKNNNDDTNNAGKYIGILERLFIFFLS